VKVAEAIKEILIETNGTYLNDLHRQLEGKILTRHRDYLTTVRLVNCLVHIGLVEFYQEADGTPLLKRRIYRVNNANLNDPRWLEYPLHVLYPATKLGALRYNHAEN
jgi:hypothetical protein